MSSSPTPDTPDYSVTLTQLREIFQSAAERSTGLGKPKFVRLSEAFNAFVEVAESGAATLRFRRAEKEFQMAKAELELFSKTDVETARILFDTIKAIGQLTETARIPDPPSPPPKKRTGRRWEI